MLHLYFGSDRGKARAKMAAEIGKMKGAEIIHITDAHSLPDLIAVLNGPGMFGEERVIVLDGVVGGSNEEMRATLVNALQILRDSKEDFFILEGALDAATRKQIEKYAQKSEKFDGAKKEKDNSIFSLANALQKGDKKALWVGLQRELIKGSAPEAIHGLLFWGAKRIVVSPRGRELVADLAELPHEARRRGEEMEYALERFVLSRA